MQASLPSLYSISHDYKFLSRETLSKMILAHLMHRKVDGGIIVHSEFSEDAYVQEIQKVYGQFRITDWMDKLFQDALLCGWYITRNIEKRTIHAQCLITGKITNRIQMKHIINATDWEILEEAEGGEELRIRRKKRAAPPASPGTEVKKAAVDATEIAEKK